MCHQDQSPRSVTKIKSIQKQKSHLIIHIFELHHEKTCLWVLNQVRHKPGCTTTEDGLYYPCSENKGADQLHGYRVQLICAFVFAYAKRQVFSRLLSRHVNERIENGFAAWYPGTSVIGDHKDEPRHEKINILVCYLVRHKPGCTATEDG